MTHISNCKSISLQTVWDTAVQNPPPLCISNIPSSKQPSYMFPLPRATVGNGGQMSIVPKILGLIGPIENNSGCFIKPRGLTGLQYYWYLIYTPTETGSRQTLCNQHLPRLLLSLLFSYNALCGSIYTMSRNVHHTLYAWQVVKSHTFQLPKNRKVLLRNACQRI